MCEKKEGRQPNVCEKKEEATECVRKKWRQLNVGWVIGRFWDWMLTGSSTFLGAGAWILE